MPTAVMVSDLHVGSIAAIMPPRVELDPVEALAANLERTVPSVKSKAMLLERCFSRPIEMARDTPG